MWSTGSDVIVCDVFCVSELGQQVQGGESHPHPPLTHYVMSLTEVLSGRQPEPLNPYARGLEANGGGSPSSL